MTKNPFTVITPERQQELINKPLPEFVANIRHLTRKEWAVHVRALFKRHGMGEMRVTTPNYSMAQSIKINCPQLDDEQQEKHYQRHIEIDETIRYVEPVWNGYVRHCAYCQDRLALHNKVEAVILAAYPDLNSRSDTQSDYFDYCLSINY